MTAAPQVRRARGLQGKGVGVGAAVGEARRGWARGDDESAAGVMEESLAVTRQARRRGSVERITGGGAGGCLCGRGEGVRDGTKWRDKTKEREIREEKIKEEKKKQKEKNGP